MGPLGARCIEADERIPLCFEASGVGPHRLRDFGDASVCIDCGCDAYNHNKEPSFANLTRLRLEGTIAALVAEMGG